MFRPRDIFLIALLFSVAVLHTYGFSLDLHHADRPLLHTVVDAIVVIISFMGVGYLMWENYRKQREITQLHTQLNHSHARISDLHNKLQQAGKGYVTVIHEQLNEWELSPTEKEVALLLLKGLSFDEIASIRHTKEKTVRQQAIAIYRKSGLNGRHAFAAWFFEDFLG
ncbi:regulatory protein, luxR family [Thiothrix caldifontis]|uniref:Regulatory protein, luxR family n=1 Tax=Thiothrix caldifontis TaxID=525918 RepID=A0A1H3VFW5_9GAMM|nr:helix-turn-helix transcriptional regulator [Thiothrix caldifontis]SDZ73649.1 regulatory protein, luxR family [Thiothrix caldifontis]